MDPELRSSGIGGSEIGALCGLDSMRDAFSVYCDKLNLLERAKPNARMRWGKLLERAISEGYAEETGFRVQWSDLSRANAQRPWQIFTIDAFVAEKADGVAYAYDGFVDCKNVDFGRAHLWGERGTDDVPSHIFLQL